MRTPCHSRAPHHGSIPCLGTIVTASALCDLWAASAEAPGKVDFARQIRPILAENCFECHGPDERGRKGKLRLDSREDVFADRDGHRVVAAGDPEESELIARITSDDPDDGDASAQVAPATDEAADRTPRRGGSPRGPPGASTGRSCLRAVRRSRRWRHRDGAATPIDRFVLARLDRAGLRPSPEADRATLIRRLCLDLLGLPPTPSEVEQFVSDGRPDAYERLVDRLLASPQFGERWARPWLDLVRYADSDGYEDDRYRPDAWRYRDWVIDAFNQDMPFDRFTIEQLAGDLVPGGSLGPRVATGFHRMTMFNRTAVGRDNEEEFRVKTAKDRASTTATVWLGLTFGCAECHTHKYDPLPQRDYYRFYAFFNNLVDTEAPAPPLSGEHLRAYQQAVREFEDAQAQAKSRLESYEKTSSPGETGRLGTLRRSRSPAAGDRRGPRRPSRIADGRPGQPDRPILPLDRPRIRTAQGGRARQRDAREQPAAAAELEGLDGRERPQAAADVRPGARRLPDARARRSGRGPPRSSLRCAAATGRSPIGMTWPAGSSTPPTR